MDTNSHEYSDPKNYCFGLLGIRVYSCPFVVKNNPVQAVLAFPPTTACSTTASTTHIAQPMRLYQR